jgi:hypothetical protein
MYHLSAENIPSVKCFVLDSSHFAIFERDRPQPGSKISGDGRRERESKTLSFPSPLVGEGGAQSAPDEGSVSADRDPSPGADGATLSHRKSGLPDLRN